MRISPQAANLIKSFESCRLSAYKDLAGVVTIGWGHTGRDVRMGQTITQKEADRLFDIDIARFEFCVEAVVGKPTSLNQFGAMVSLAYNIGCGRFATSTVAKQHRKGNYRLAAAAFMLFVKARKGGVKQTIRGLVRRRNAERRLYEQRL